MPPIARRVLAAVLGCLLAIQSVGATSPGCTIGGLLTGRGVCCCAAPEGGSASSCCSAEESPATPDGASVEPSEESCACGVDAPAPTSSLPAESGARGEHRDTQTLTHWIDQGARVSSAAPWIPSPTTHDPPGSRSPTVPDTVARACERGVNGLLAVLGVVRA
jgi:hypothetical protein